VHPSAIFFFRGQIRAKKKLFFQIFFFSEIESECMPVARARGANVSRRFGSVMSAVTATPPIALRSLSPAAGRAWFASLDTWLLDCDGVVWRGSEGVPGVAAAVAALRRAGKAVYYVSNNSTKTRGEYARKLAGVAGIAPAHAREEAVVTSAVAAAAWCAARGVAAAYVIGSPALVTELAAAGVACVGGPADGGAPAFAFGDMTPQQLDARVRAVVVGFDGGANYVKLARAASYLRYGGPAADGAGVAFVATNADLTFPDAAQLVPGGGVLVGAVAAAAGRQPDVVAGKPSLAMLDILAAVPAPAAGGGGGGLERARTVMVGDRLDTDILFGAQAGLGATLLVYTGVTQRGEVAALPAGDARTPSHELDSLGDLAQLLEQWGVLAADGGGAAGAAALE